VDMEFVESRRCGAIEMLEVQEVDESDMRTHEYADYSVCYSCRLFDRYRCLNWSASRYEI